MTDFLNNIFINLLSDAIWATGVLLFAKAFLKKKPSLFANGEQDQKKLIKVVLKQLIKKTFFSKRGHDRIYPAVRISYHDAYNIGIEPAFKKKPFGYPDRS